MTSQYLKLAIKDIKKNDAKNSINELIQVISTHNKLYYEVAQPIISDTEYDHLFSLLLSLEERYPEYKQQNSPTNKIWTTQLLDWFSKAEHKVSLISLSNSYNADDLLTRHEQLERIATKEGIDSRTYLIEPKLDGSSVEIIYKQGRYTQAITRGDGQIWEDITKNVAKLRNIPLYIQDFESLDEVRLRAEIVMPKNSFETLNQTQAINNESLFANPRNAAAGTLRQLDPSIVYQRWLIVYVYDILSWLTTNTHQQGIQLLKDAWVPVHPWGVQWLSIQEVIEHCKDPKVQKLLESDNTEMDGLVIKVNEMSHRDIFGSTEHHPRRAIAYKFPAKQVAAHINDITYQIGRTWVLTPVAELDPVSLSWVTISRATLHNFDYIAQRDIRKDDWVWVQRSGEVIPYILWPILERRPNAAKKIIPPKTCPWCWGWVEQEVGEVAYICTNNECEAQLSQQLSHFVSKNCLNIQGLGESIIQSFITSWLISSYTDLYDLPNKTLEVKSLDGIWDKKIQTIFSELERTKTTDLRRWIHAIWIKWVGKKVAQDLAKAFAQRRTKNKIAYSSITQIWKFFSETEYLTGIFGLWEQSILSLNTRAQEHAWTLQILDTYWILPQLAIEKQSSSKLSWKKIVITWSFSWYSRDELGNYLQEHGAQISSSVSKNTDYLLCGEKAGSKLTKAQELWIQCIDLEELGELVWETPVKEKTNNLLQDSLF